MTTCHHSSWDYECDNCINIALKEAGGLTLRQLVKDLSESRKMWIKGYDAYADKFNDAIAKNDMLFKQMHKIMNERDDAKAHLARTRALIFEAECYGITGNGMEDWNCCPWCASDEFAKPKGIVHKPDCQAFMGPGLVR